MALTGMLAAAVLAVITTGQGEAKGEPEQAVVAPPPAIQPVAAEVLRGGRVRIDVRAVPRGGSSARVLVRSRPRHGVVEAAPGPDATTARFIYEHDGGAATADEFLVAAQSPGSPVSASVKVSISIIEPQPVFKAPGAATLPTAYSLDEQTLAIELRNEGGGVVEGVAAADPPWSLPDGGRYRIPAGGSQSLRVVFRPDAFRQYAGFVRYSSAEGAATRLEAAIARPLAVEPSRLDFARADADATQGLTLSNASPTDLSVTLVAPDWIVAPGGVVVPAGGSAVVGLAAAAPGTAPLEGVVVLATGGYEQSVVVAVPAAGADMEAELVGGGFPATPVGGFSEAVLAMRNNGGLAARVEITTPDGFSLAGGVERVLVEPGGEAAVRLAFRPSREGGHAGGLVLRWESGEIRVPLAATALPPDTPAPPPGTAAHRAAPAQAADSGAARGKPPQGQAPFTAPDDFANRRNDDLPPPATAVRVAERRHHEAVLEWNRNAAAPEGFFIEIRWLRMGKSGLPEFYWLEFTDAMPLADDAPGKTRRVLLRNLYAGTLYGFRISSLDADGRLSRPVDAPMFATLPKHKARLSPPAVLGSLAAALVLLAAWRRWRARRLGDLEAHD